MSWADVLGHESQIELFRRIIARGHLASTFLFVGDEGIGKLRFARTLAQALLCERNPETVLEPCGTCPACQQVAAGTHPDLLLVSRPPDRAFIPLELLIGDGEHRMREGLCHDISLKPYCGGRRVAILDDVDYLNQEGANCLLKTLEEPPPRSVIILIGTSEQRQLPTIRSRSQVVRFRPLTVQQVEQILWTQQLVETPEEAQRLAELSGGSVQRALECAAPEVASFRERWHRYLASASDCPFEMAKELSAFVDAAGKEAPPRRQRTKQVARWSTDFYRAVALHLNAHPVDADPLVTQAVSTATRWLCTDETALRALERCLEVHSHVEANANQATMLECWLDDLATLTRT